MMSMTLRECVLVYAILISECITRNTDWSGSWINTRGNWSMMTAEDESRHTRIGFIIISYSIGAILHPQRSLRTFVEGYSLIA